MSDETDAQARARVGEVLNDKWTLERLLGAGGMGAVYAGRHRNGARAAVKVLHRALSAHLEVRARFLREGYAANRVDRPGVVKVLDDDVVVGGPDDGTAYLVMELLEGQSLEGRIASGWAITERQFLALADAVLDVLDAAHANGVVHRDIKPDNIFIAMDETGVERVKLLDFGLARLLEGRSTTSHGIAIGTPSFMSPEQAGGRNDEIDGRTDLFALAASGFRVITGRRVHEAPSPIEVMAKMASLPAPRIQTIAPAVSSMFARIIDRALEWKREDRYETAALMRSDVQNAIAALDMGLAVPGPAVVATEERSIELSVKDFEPSKAICVPESISLQTSPPEPAPAPEPPPPAPVFLVPSLDLPVPPASDPSASRAPRTLINAPSLGPAPPKAPSMPSVSAALTTRDPVAPSEPLEGMSSSPEAKRTVLSFGKPALRVPTTPEELPSVALGGQVSALLQLSESPEVLSPSQHVVAGAPLQSAEAAPLPFAPLAGKSEPLPETSLPPEVPPESHRDAIDALPEAPEPPPGRPEAPPMHAAFEPRYPEESLAEIPVQRVPFLPLAVVGGVLLVGAAVGLLASSRSPGTPTSVAPGSPGLDMTIELDATLVDAGADAASGAEVSPVAAIQRDASPSKPRGFPTHVPNRGRVPPVKPAKRPSH